MFLNLLLSSSRSVSFYNQHISKEAKEIDSSGNTTYFLFQKGDEQKIENLEISFNNKTIKPEHGKGYAFTDGVITIKNSGNTSILVKYWKIPKETCPENVYMLSTTIQLRATTDSKSFCYFSPYLFSSGTFALASSNYMKGEFYKIYNSYGIDVTPEKNSEKISTISPFFVAHKKQEEDVTTSLLLSVMNSDKTYNPSQCDVTAFETYGEKKEVVGSAPSIKCNNLADAAFSAAWFTVAVICFFTLLMFILNKLGIIDFKKFFATQEGEEFGALPDASDEENMIDPFQAGVDVHEGQL